MSSLLNKMIQLFVLVIEEKKINKFYTKRIFYFDHFIFLDINLTQDLGNKLDYCNSSVAK